MMAIIQGGSEVAAGALHSWEQTDTKPDEPGFSPADFRDEKHQSRVLPEQAI